MLTEQVFKESPFVLGERIYDTGDIGYWTPEGELVLTGRQDDQIKLRGLRVELQEVSSCIESYKGVTSALATVREVNGQQVLGAYYCADEPIDEMLLLAYTATYLPQYMVPAFIMYMEEIPVSANGKADIHKLPIPEISCKENDEMLTDWEQKVLVVFQEVLKTEELYGGSDYFLSGGNSLNAMECMIKIEEATGCRIRIADLYAFRTAKRLAAYIEGQKRNGQSPNFADRQKKWFKNMSGKKVHPMSPVQQGMYIQSMLDPTGLSYNMPGAFLLSEKPDITRLKEAFVTLIDAEPILRTAYRQSAEGIKAHIVEDTNFELENLTGENFKDAAKNFVRPFDLAKSPLLRGGLWESEEGWYLFLDSHHIVGDGMSTPILLERLNLAYQKKGNAVKWNYYDYLSNSVMKQNNLEKEEMLKYWKDSLKDLPDTLKLPGDYPVNGKFDFKGRDFEYQIARDRSLSCESFCKAKGISEFTLFLAAYGILLAEVTGRSDFVIGAPAAGRLEGESRQIMGPFINTLPLRLTVNKKGTVKEWLNTVSNLVTGMLDHQKVSLEEIIRELHLPRGQQNALYQVMMTQSPVDESSFVFDGKPMEYHPISTGCVKMDLILDLSKKGEDYRLRFSYADSLFRSETIMFYARCIEQIVGQLMEDMDRKLKDIGVLSPEDEKKYVTIPNEKKTAFEKRPIHQILKEISQTRGRDTAIIYHGKEWSFDWLEGRGGAIARFIEQAGVNPGTPVALCLSRTPDMIAAMYGVLKAGCAYVFMLPSFPEARLTYMTEITKAELVFYDDQALEKMPVEYLEGLTSCKAYRLPEGEDKEYEDRPIQKDYRAFLQIIDVHITTND